MAAPQGLSSIVVPTDFSAGAAQALERALTLPLASKAKLTVIHVLPDDIPGTLHAQAVEEAGRSLEQVLARCRQQAQVHALKGLTVVGDVLEGDPAQQIAKRARTVEADVVCLGRHGRRPVLDLFVGSTVQKLARTGGVPLLVVQLPSAPPYHRPLVAVDLEKSAQQVVRAAGRLLGKQARWVDLLHCVSVGYDDFVKLTDPESRVLRQGHIDDAQRVLAGLGKRSRLPITARPQVQAGDARSLILEAAKEHQTDLLAVGTRARSGLKRLLLGSVAEWVLGHATCDVLVVPAG